MSDQGHAITPGGSGRGSRRSRPATVLPALVLALLPTLPLVAGGTAPRLSGRGAETGAAEDLSLSVYKIWASKKEKPGKCPRALARLEKILKKKTARGKKRYNCFRLVERPTVRKVTPGARTVHRLPEGYTLALTPEREKGTLVLRYHLSNRDGTFSSKLKIRPKKGKPFIVLPPIRRGTEQLVIVLVCAPPAKR